MSTAQAASHSCGRCNREPTQGRNRAGRNRRAAQANQSPLGRYCGFAPRASADTGDRQRDRRADKTGDTVLSPTLAVRVKSLTKTGVTYPVSYSSESIRANHQEPIFTGCCERRARLTTRRHEAVSPNARVSRAHESNTQRPTILKNTWIRVDLISRRVRSAERILGTKPEGRS